MVTGATQQAAKESAGTKKRGHFSSFLLLNQEFVLTSLFIRHTFCSKIEIDNQVDKQAERYRLFILIRLS
jgi:hypothetical protein